MHTLPNPSSFIAISCLSHPLNPTFTHCRSRAYRRNPKHFSRSSIPVRMSVGELACSYAALILHDDGIAVTSDKIATLVKAANLNIESYWAGLFAKLCEKKDIEDLILNVGAGGGGAVAVAAPVGGAAPAAAAAPVEEKKEEPKEESDDDIGFSLFDE